MTPQNSISAVLVPRAMSEAWNCGTEIGLRLRYMLHKNFLTCIGINYVRYCGDTATFVQADDERSHHPQRVLRFKGWLQAAAEARLLRFWLR